MSPDFPYNKALSCFRLILSSFPITCVTSTISFPNKTQPITLASKYYEPSKMLIDSSRPQSHLHYMAANNPSVCHGVIYLSRAIAKSMKLNIIAIAAEPLPNQHFGFLYCICSKVHLFLCRYDYPGLFLCKKFDW